MRSLDGVPAPSTSWAGLHRGAIQRTVRTTFFTTPTRDSIPSASRFRRVPRARATRPRAVPGPRCRVLAPLSFMQPVLSPMAVICFTSSTRERIDLRKRGEFVDLALDGLRAFVGFLDQGGHDAFHGFLREVPEAGKLERGQAVTLARWAAPGRAFHCRARPSRRGGGCGGRRRGTCGRAARRHGKSRRSPRRAPEA